MYQNALLNRAHVKRKVYFAFHYQEDIHRTGIVRNSWVTHNKSTLLVPSFTDSSLWESAKALGDENLKRVMRDGVNGTSAVCVLAGANTYARRWVRYEIARSVIDQKGLLTVHINGLRCMNTKQQSSMGHNPLELMAVVQRSGRYYLWEFSSYLGRWTAYSDYTFSVPKPRYMPSFSDGVIAPLSLYTSVYDFCRDDGYRNLGKWVNQAAFEAGR